MLRNIIWDVDGTLFDTYPAIAEAFKAALNDLSQDAPLDWIESLTKESLSHCASVLAEKYHLELDDIERAFEAQYSRVTVDECPPFPGVIDLCQFICSLEGKNVIVTHRGRKSTTELLAANNMVDYFAGYLTRDDGYPRKPDPAVFIAALESNNLEREATVNIGDRRIDIVAGQAVGIFSCLYGSKIEGVMPDLFVNNYYDLYQFILDQTKEQ